MRATRRALKRRLPELKAQARAAIDANPALVAARRKRRRRRAAFSALLLLLLLFVRCDCGEPAPSEPATPDAGVPQVVKPKPMAAKVKPGPLTGKVATQPRGAFGTGEPVSPPWLDEFRIQVAARSPRLAQCFTGIDRPGALRWSALVNPQGGTVSDHTIETVGVGTDLTQEQRTCVIGVLQSPVYRLTVPGNEGLPNRVSLVIEF
jgi:hypothetical protein